MKHRSPDSITPADVCPHCKRPVYLRFEFDSAPFIHHCREHGEVTPIRSAVHNEPDWSAA